MKKKLLAGLAAGVLMIFGARSSQATLFERGSGLIYDDVLDITWMQDANYSVTSGYWDTLGYNDPQWSPGMMTWSEALQWTSQLQYGGYTDWRLPEILPVNGVSYNYTFADNGSTDDGYNISASGTVYEGSTGSEQANLFYSSLGNAPYSLQSTGPFYNIQLGRYWSGTEYPPKSSLAWDFSFSHGSQHNSTKAANVYAWAVRDGDVSPVPEPTTMLLFGTGIAGLIGTRRKKNRMQT